MVTVPPGVCAGDTMRVEAKWGGAFELTVPHGLLAGMQMVVMLPRMPPPAEHRPVDLPFEWPQEWRYASSRNPPRYGI